MNGYPSGQDGAILPARDFSLGPARSKIILFGVLSHIINPLLTKLVLSRWLDIGLLLFFRVSRSINTPRHDALCLGLKFKISKRGYFDPSHSEHVRVSFAPVREFHVIVF